MRYDAYRAQVSRAAAATGGRVVSLAGGYVGVQLEAGVILALDLDGVLPEWLCWQEDGDGERCCDDNAQVLGVVSPARYAELPLLAVSALRSHAHTAREDYVTVSQSGAWQVEVGE